MITIKKLETIEISGTTEDEVNTEVKRYISIGYELEHGVSINDDENDEYPYYAYVTKDEFNT